MRSTVALKYLYYYFLIASKNITRTREEEQSFRSSICDTDDSIFDIYSTAISSLTALLQGQTKRQLKKRVKLDEQKKWWTNGYRNWKNEQFRTRLRINRQGFKYLLDELSPLITKTPTNSVPHPIEGKLNDNSFIFIPVFISIYFACALVPQFLGSKYS